MPFPGNARPPDGLPTGPSRACIAGSPTARCDSKRQELARDVPAEQFVELEGDPPGDQLLREPTFFSNNGSHIVETFPAEVKGESAKKCNASLNSGV